MLCVVTRSITILIILTLDVKCYAGFRMYAEYPVFYRYAECHLGECHYAEYRYSRNHYAQCINAACHYAEYNCAECHYPEYH